MELRIVTAGQLIAFTKETAFEQLPQLPITVLRAVSQHHNPHAHPDDPALIIAYDEKKAAILAYFGCLPDRLQGDKAVNLCWSSCWWAHPTKGNAAVMPVFYKALQLWNGRMLFDALPGRSHAILRSMGHFSFRKLEGIQGYLRFKWHKAIPTRLPILAPLKSILYVLDTILNIPINGWLSFQKRRWRLPKGLQLTYVEELDEELDAFIRQNATKELITRSSQQFNWVINHPWLSQSKDDASRYYFSAYARSFENRLIKVHRQEELIAFLWLTVRDGTVKIPYCYVSQGAEALTAQVLVHQLLRESAEVFICFQAHLMPYLQKTRLPFFHKKPIAKIFGWTKSLDSFFETVPYIQDGDGDGVFT